MSKMLERELGMEYQVVVYCNDVGGSPGNGGVYPTREAAEAALREALQDLDVLGGHIEPRTK